MNLLGIKQKIYELASHVVEDEGFELVKVDVLGQGRRMLVRITVDKEGGVTVGDCENVSRSIEALLDVHDPIKGPYMLEVSSPGLDRPLVKQKDFERNIGKLARIVTTDKIENQTFFIGRIMDVGEGWVRLRIEKKGDKKEGSHDIFVPFEKISKARLEVEIK